MERKMEHATATGGKSVYVFVVWSFLLFVLFEWFMFFAVWAGVCFLFCCLGGGVGPAQTAKKKDTAQTAKNKHASDPSERVFFLLFGRVGVFSFCCLGGGRVFLLFGRGGRVFFCCLGGGRVFFCCLCGGACVFFAVWVGDENSLTYRSAWLVFKGPNNKKDQTAKTNTGSGNWVLE